jgi:hypothetical protein
MKLRSKFAVVSAFIALTSVIGLARWKGAAPIAVAQTRRELRAQGFKTDLADFNFSTSDETQARMVALTNIQGIAWGVYGNGNSPSLFSAAASSQMRMVTADAATIGWRQDNLPAAQPGTQANDSWAALRDVLTWNRSALDQACAAALSGPIAFDLDASLGHRMLLHHLPPLRTVQNIFAARALLDLHDGVLDTAWTNLLAATRIVTSWEPDPSEISHAMRFDLTDVAFRITWEALQARAWSEPQLHQLEAEWSAVDFFKGLPDTAAFTRAANIDMCIRFRNTPQVGPPMQLLDMLKEPRSALDDMRTRARMAWYLERGTFEDEKDLLLFYRDRESELRRAIHAPSWQQMQIMPGVTNRPSFLSNTRSDFQSIVNMRETPLRLSTRGIPLLGRAAEAETTRRLILAAIAVEKFHLRHSAYPNTLEGLAAAPKALIDFMDGHPLRYRPTAQGAYILYSVGFDCVDNGGATLLPSSIFILFDAPFRARRDTDIVWPQPTSSQGELGPKLKSVPKTKLNKTLY